MKLLNKKDIEDKKRIGMVRELKLAQKVRKVTETARKALNDDKIQFVQEKEKLEQDFEKFIDKTTEKRSKLTGEVKILEDKKKEALKPITALKKEAEKQMKENDKKEKDLNNKEATLERAESNHERKVKNLQEKEALNVKEEEGVAEKLKGVIIREAQLKTNENELTSYITEQRKLISDSVEDLDTKAHDLKQKEVALNNERKALTTQRDEITEAWRVVNDQRSTLERAMKRINK